MRCAETSATEAPPAVPSSSSAICESPSDPSSSPVAPSGRLSPCTRLCKTPASAAVGRSGVGRASAIAASLQAYPFLANGVVAPRAFASSSVCGLRALFSLQKRRRTSRFRSLNAGRCTYTRRRWTHGSFPVPLHMSRIYCQRHGRRQEAVLKERNGVQHAPVSASAEGAGDVERFSAGSAVSPDIVVRFRLFAEVKLRE